MFHANSFSGKRFLVSGGAGFLGSHLCEMLLARGGSVVAVDDFITGRRKNLNQLLQSRSFELIESDITRPFGIDGKLAGIFHFASPASPVDYMQHSIETLRAGAMGAENVLVLAERKDCPILIASTSEVYGDPLEHPQRETYWGNVNPVGPRSCYDESKRYQEAMTVAYHRVHNVPVRIMRIFNTYGPRMRADDGRVVPNFCLQALRGEPLTVYGDGSQTRSFCFYEDLLEGCLRLFCSDCTGPVNIGNPEEHTILEFAQRIISLADSKSVIIHLPPVVDDPHLRCPDISLAKKLLGWKPRISLNQGLKATIEYFRGELKEGRAAPSRPQPASAH